MQRSSSKEISATRSIKFPLAPDESSEKYAALAECIRQDAIGLYGPLNYSDWLRHQDAPIYSFLDFWIDALLLGGVFQQSAPDLFNLGATLKGRDPVKRFEVPLMKHLRPELAGLIEVERIYEFVTKHKRVTKGDPARKIDQVFTKSALKESPEVVERLRREWGGIFPKLGGLSGQERVLEKTKMFLCGEGGSTEDWLEVLGVSQKTTRQETTETDGPLTGLTYLLVPELEAQNLSDDGRGIRGEDLSRTIQQLERFRLLHFPSMPIDSLLSLSSNYNALSNFGGTFIKALRKEDGVSIALNAMKQRLPYSTAEEAEVVRRLKLLRERALRLPEAPKLTLDHGYYRTELGGKLKSWFENRKNYEKNIKDALEKLLQELDRRSTEVRKATRPDSVGELGPQIEHLKALAKSLLTLSDLLAPDAKILYQELKGEIASHETLWNEFVQKEKSLANRDDPPKTRKGSKKVNNEEETEASLIRLPKFPAFFGDEKRLTYGKVTVAPRLLKNVLGAIRECLRGEELSQIVIGDGDDRAKLLQRLLVRIRAIKELKTDRFSIALTSDGPFGDFLKLKPYEVFHINQKAAQRGKVVPPLSEEVLKNALTALGTLTWEGLKDFKEILGTASGAQTLRAILQAAQTLLALIVTSVRGADMVTAAGGRISEEKVTNTCDFAFPKVRALYISKETYRDKGRLPGLIAARMGSEASGLLAILSQKTQIERYTIQAINGEQVNLFASNHIEANAKRFAVGFPRWKANGAEELRDAYPILFVEGNTVVPVSRDGGELTKPRQAAAPDFEIRSSKYQIQFLRWAWSKPKGKSCSLKPGGSFVILERKMQLSTSGDELVATPTSEDRIFVSIPFEMKPVRESESRAPAQEVFRDSIAIGVDVGEYGLAYCVVKKEVTTGNQMQLSMMEAGVLTEGSHRVLRKKVGTLKRRQKVGVFLASDTSVARVREALVGAYTNELHSLVLKWKCPLVFEWNISVFEAGGNRIKTVYDTIKRTDCSPKNDAHKARKKHVWGTEYLRSGYEVNAHVTSQTCAHCKRWYGQVLSDASEEELASALSDAKPVEIAGHYVAHELPWTNCRIRFFVPRSLRDGVRSWSKEQLKGAIKRYIRPPLWRLGKGALPKNARNRRGNSSIFRCPFSDCGIVSDADIQAGFNIAARYFLKVSGHLTGQPQWTQVYEERTHTTPPILHKKDFGARS